MPDSLANKEMNDNQQERRKYLIAVAVALVLVSLPVFSALHEKHRQKELNRVGGMVGIVNSSDHRVSICIFGHDSAGVVQHRYELSPGDELVIRDSMSLAEVVAFPPKGFVDSAWMVFDDRVVARHVGEYPWEVGYNDHCIHNSVHWEYAGITVRNFNPMTGSGILKRPVRRYILSNDDYDRAVAAKR